MIERGVRTPPRPPHGRVMPEAEVRRYIVHDRSCPAFLETAACPLSCICGYRAVARALRAGRK